MQQNSKEAAFKLGQIVATPGALAALKKAGQQPSEFLTRHVNREWGHVSDEDRKENEYGPEHGFRLLSVYRTNGRVGTCRMGIAVDGRPPLDYYRRGPFSDHTLLPEEY